MLMKFQCPFRLAVRTIPFHGVNAGSIPARGIIRFYYTVFLRFFSLYMLPLFTLFPEMSHAQILFMIGIFGLGFNSGNVITMLMSLELMLAGAGLIFLTSSFLLDDIGGQIFAIFILTVAAAESAIGLAMLVVYYKLTGSISIDRMILLRG